MKNTFNFSCCMVALVIIVSMTTVGNWFLSFIAIAALLTITVGKEGRDNDDN